MGDQVLKDIEFSSRYYDPPNPGSRGGKSKLKRALKKSVKETAIDHWLQSQEAYTLHKPVRKKFKRRSTLVSGMNDQFQADLIDMQKYSKFNNGYNYILTVIDVFSRFAWVRPIKQKTGHQMVTALKVIFEQQRCRAIQTDKGREFFNKNVKNLFKKFSIHHFTSENYDIKASVVERFNRTLQVKLYRWFTKTKTFNWVTVIQSMVDGYNDTTHSSIGMPPKEVNNKNQEQVWHKLYTSQSIIAKHSRKKKEQLKIGDVVRISKYKHVFSKGYEANWSTELFFIAEVLNTSPRTFRLKDHDSEKIVGTYYNEELQKVSLPSFFDIEEVIKSKKVRGRKKFFVKWKGYPLNFNSWIDENDFSA